MPELRNFDHFANRLISASFTVMDCRRVEQYDRRDGRPPDHSMGRREEQPVFGSSRFAGAFESRGARDAASSAVSRRWDVRDTRDRDERRLDMGRDRVSGKARDPTQRTHSSPHDSPRRATVREEWKGERSVVTDRRDTRLVEKRRGVEQLLHSSKRLWVMTSH